MSAEKGRSRALQVLLAVEGQGAYSNLALKQATRGCTSEEAAFVKQLVFGTLTYQISLDYLLQLCLDRSLQKLTAPVRNILRMGAFQLLYLHVPDHAAVSESVNLARRYGHKGVAGLVNAVLRRLAREAAALPWPESDDPAYDLSIRYSHPLWMVRRWLQRFGPEETAAFCQANNEPPGVDLRVNRLRTTTADLLTELAKNGLTAQASDRVPDCIHLPSGGNAVDTAAFQEGRCTVQGAASTLVGHVVAPQRGELAYDLCAAPGGKTTHLAELMDDTGTVVGVDVHPERLKLVVRAAERLGLTSIQTKSLNSAEIQHQAWQKAERVLLDAPCSGLGVIRRKADIRLQREAVDIDHLAVTQATLLRAASEMVKPGGVLVYSVCSTEPEETTAITDSFLADNPDFKPAEWPAELPAHLHSEVKEGSLFTYPHRHGLDGFYICRLERHR